MNIEEIIVNFLKTGAAIYGIAAMKAKSDGEDVPDSITLSGTRADGDVIEITIAVKCGD